MRFGFHISIAGGFAKVRGRAEKLGCEAIQLFSSNPRGWAVAALDEEDVVQFRQDIQESNISPVFVHAPYLPNLAATDKTYARKTLDALVQQMERCRALGIDYLICHVGKAMGTSDQAAMAQVATQLNRILSAAPNQGKVLLENTAGMGSEVGYRFEQIAAIIGQVEQRDRLGVVLDTAHAFEAGYDLRTRAGLDAALRDFDRTIGLGRLHLVHLNDSKTELGSRVDRHWHIGKGRIGRAGISGIVNHPLLCNLPAVMETPRRSDADDKRNMKTVRLLART